MTYFETLNFAFLFVRGVRAGIRLSMAHQDVEQIPRQVSAASTIKFQKVAYSWEFKRFVFYALKYQIINNVTMVTNYY